MRATHTTPEVHSSPPREARPAMRRFPIGAEVQENGVHFRVWAPRSKRVAVAVENMPPAFLEAEAHGYFSGFISGIDAGSFYKLRLENGDFPDPASRFQPQGPHGPSQVIDPSSFSWTDQRMEGSASRRAGLVRNAHRHIHPGGHLACRRGAAPRSGQTRGHTSRSHARGGVLRPIRLGLRWRGSLRTHASLRRTR